MRDSADEWAMKLWTDRMNLYHPNCYDADSCGFFFDGYALEMIFTNTNSDNDWGTGDDFYACTMPLNEEDSWLINDWITEYSYIPRSMSDLWDILGDQTIDDFETYIGDDKFF